MRTMRQYLTVFKEAFTEFNDDKAPAWERRLPTTRSSPSVPLLLIAVAMAGIFLGAVAVVAFATRLTDWLSDELDLS